MKTKPTPLADSGRADRATPFAASAAGNALPCARIAKLTETWLTDCEVRQHTRRTIESRKAVLDKVIWWANKHQVETLDRATVRDYLAYVGGRKPAPNGRWDCKRATGPVAAGTVATHYRILRTFFNWLIAEEELDRSPLHKVAAPVDRPDQIQPFNADQVRALLSAAEKSTVAKRNVALLSLLLDTGLRATEVCSITFGEVDVTARSVDVLGKGNKRRKVFYGAATARALWRFIKAKPRNDADPLFQCQRGKGVGQALTIAGLHQMIAELGQDAGIHGVRCSPHTCRHTFAINFLRAGGNEFTLQEILGHTSLAMTRRYVHLAEADVAAQSRRFSPVDALNRK